MSNPGKYRGLRLDNGEWVYGWYVYSEQLNAHYIVEAGFQSNYTCVNSPGIIYVQGSYEVRPETVGQSTPLDDKKGRGMYAGDIIKAVDAILVVAWHFNRWVMKDGKGRIKEFRQIDQCFYEIIGDIHTTPQLMEQP